MIGNDRGSEVIDEHGNKYALIREHYRRIGEHRAGVEQEAQGQNFVLGNPPEQVK